MTRTKRTVFTYTAAILVWCLTPQAGAQTPLGSGWTYQGKLNVGGIPLNDTADFEFTLWDADVDGNMVGEVVEANDVDVIDGLFTVKLDFGAEAFNGEARWLEIDVRSPAGGGEFTPLDPRQPLTAAPYALALPALRTEPGIDGPNIIAGHAGNSVDPGVSGATIGGGGQSNGPNLITGSFGSIGGGSHNTASASFSTVDGGGFNNAGDYASTVGGGAENNASGYISTVGGGGLNNAGGDHASVGGGLSNRANGVRATVPGGHENEANGDFSLAAGRQAKANHDGAFVWGDSTREDFASTAADQFLIRAAGGVGIGTTTPNDTLQVGGNANQGITIANPSPVLTLDDTDANSWTMRVSGLNLLFEEEEFGLTMTLEQDSRNVGIGESNPSARLDVVGTTELNGDVTINSDLTVDNVQATGTVAAEAFVGDGSGLSGLAGSTVDLDSVALLRWDLLNRSFPVGVLPSGIAFDGANIWVTSSASNVVFKRRASDGAFLGVFPVGSGPHGVAFDGANIWVTNSNSDTVTKLRASNGVNLGTLPVGDNPVGVAFDGANIWVANSQSNNVTRISLVK